MVSVSVGADLGTGLGIAAATAAVTTAGVLGSDKIKIINYNNPLELVVFDLNPEKVTVTIQQKAKPQTRAAPSGTGLGSGAATVMGGGSSGGGTTQRSQGDEGVEITFDAILDEYRVAFPGTPGAIVGAITGAPSGQVREKVDMLLKWCQPETQMGGLMGAVTSLIGGAMNLKWHTPKLLLQWGVPMIGGFMMFGVLKRVQATYIQFSPLGTPTRAKVNIKFVEEPNPILQMLTNPTSGGVPGRRGRMVHDGENLQSIATGNYGNPRLWRQVAEANEIDDPLRVRPGKKLFLPSPREIEPRS